MDANELIRERFQELSDQVSQLRQLDEYTYGGEVATKWATRAASLIRRVFGENSDHYQQFKGKLDNVGLTHRFEPARGIFNAAREDFEKGALFEVRHLVTAELFADFLDQADYLLEADYKGPAAVVAGAVLEDGLRKLCGQSGIGLSDRPKLDWMNAELAKKGIYDKLRQKQITWLADIGCPHEAHVFCDFVSCIAS